MTEYYASDIPSLDKYRKGMKMYTFSSVVYLAKKDILWYSETVTWGGLPCGNKIVL